MDYDVVVVGAGPAGSTTAMECGRRGLNTLILEKEHLPRYKPCGGGLTNKTLKVIGCRLPNRLIQGVVRGVRFHYRGDSTTYVSNKTLITMVDRGDFDKYLADRAVKAGAKLEEGVTVDDVTVAERGCVVKAGKRRISCQVVVGADGVKSTVAREVRPPFKSDEVVLALEVEVPRDGFRGDFSDGYSQVYFDCGCRGYGWVFPKKYHYSIGVGGLLNSFRDSRLLFDRYMGRLGFDGRDYKVHAHLIPIGKGGRKVTADRKILVGDAAGYAEPLTGEGIYYAIRSGQLAAETIMHASLVGDYSERGLGGYDDSCAHEFYTEFRRSNKAMKAMFALRPLSMRLLFSNEEIIERFAHIQSGDSTYKDFKRWFVSQAPRLAGRTILKGMF